MTPRTEPSATTWPYRPDIDGLRAVAVVGVMLFHAFPLNFTGGFVGVDIFFVISGFLITGLILANINAGRFTFRDFYARRIRRIFPALILVLAALLAFGWLTLLAGDYRLLGTHVATASVFISNIQLWRETGYFDQVSWTKPLMHLWSLGVEEQFYMFWPAVVVLAARARRLTQTMVLLAGASLVFSVMSTPAHQSLAFFWPLTRLWELLAGSIVAYVAVYRRDLLATIEAGAWQRHALALAGVVLIAIAMLALSERTAFPGAWALLPVLGTVALIVAGPGAVVNRWLALKVVVWVGLISYPLYLWHWPILTLLRIIGGGFPSVSSRLLALAAAAALATITYVAVERPIRSRRPSLQATGVLLSLLAILGGWGYVVRISDGFPNRHPSIVEPVIDLDAQFNRRHCHLEKDDRPVDFDPACGGPASTTAPLVAIVGDSHMGELSESLRKRQDRDGFRLAQFTVGTCIPGSPVQKCRQFFDWILDRLKANPPQVLLLGARWAVDDAANVPAFLARLRDAGVDHVIVIGPTPEWTAKPSRILVHAATGGSIWLSDLAKVNEVPKATSFGLLAEPFAADQSLRKAVGETIPYVSPIEMLCNKARECLTLTPAGGHMWGDVHHLSPQGSDWFVDAIIPRVRSFF